MTQAELQGGSELTQGSQMLMPSASQAAEVNSWGDPAEEYVDPPDSSSEICHICLCSCIGGFTWAAKRCGMKTEYFAEIDEVWNACLSIELDWVCAGVPISDPSHPQGRRVPWA